MPSAPRAAHAQPVGEVAGGFAVSQTFGVMAGGLSGITISARPFAATVEGDVVFTLTRSGRPGRPELWRRSRRGSPPAKSRAW